MAYTTSGTSLTPQQYQQLLTNQYSYGSTTVTASHAANNFVCCAECRSTFKGGLGGDEAQSYDEAVVAAYANGWYVGKNLKICLDCRKKIDPKDKVDEDLLQTDN